MFCKLRVILCGIVTDVVVIHMHKQQTKFVTVMIQR